MYFIFFSSKRRYKIDISTPISGNTNKIRPSRDVDLVSIDDKTAKRCRFSPLLHGSLSLLVSRKCKTPLKRVSIFTHFDTSTPKNVNLSKKSTPVYERKFLHVRYT